MNLKIAACAASFLFILMDLSADKIDDLLAESTAPAKDKPAASKIKKDARTSPKSSSAPAPVSDSKSASAASADIDSEAFKLDPELEIFVKTAKPDQLNLKLLQIFAANRMMEKALIYANKILESPTAPKADKLAVLNGANWTVKRTYKAMVTNRKDAVKDEKYWGGLIGDTEYTSRMYCYYSVFTSESISENEVKKRAEDNIKYRKKLIEIDSENPKNKLELAEEYINQNNADEAMPILEELYKKPVPAADARGDAKRLYSNVCLDYANVLFMKGDRKGAINVMEKYMEAGVFDTQIRGGWWVKREAEFYLYTLRDHGRFDLKNCPAYTGAKAYPEAKEAEYSENFVPLSSVKLELGGGLTKDSAQVRYLTSKLESYGIKISDSAAFTIRFNTDSLKAPEKAEGYTVKVSDSGADLQGGDRLGTTWAAVTFIQLIDHEKAPKIRVAFVRDWTDMKFRGNWGKSWDINYPEFLISRKLNLTAIGSYLVLMNARMNGIPENRPMLREAQKEYIKLMHELGINVYVTMSTSWHMPKTSERTFQYYTDIFKEIAASGANVWWLHDDSSADGQPELDIKNSDGDIYKAVMAEFPLLNRLNAETKKTYPNFKLMFSPIYYFYPEGQSYFGIPKGKYMTDMGNSLDKDIEVMWCGPKVRGTKIDKDLIDEWTKLLHRKPAFWQNPYTPHEDPYRTVLGDCFPGWSSFHYKGFFDDITMYFDAGDIWDRGFLLTEYANFAWNLSKLENCSFEVSEQTQRLAYDFCFGKGALDVIKPGAEAVWELDAYPIHFATYMAHDSRTNIQRALMEYEHVLKAIDATEKQWEKMKELYPDGIALIQSRYNEVAGRVRLGDKIEALVAKLGRPALMEAAAKEGNFNANAGDQFKSAAEFFGGAETQPLVFAVKNNLAFDQNGPYRKKVFGVGSKDIRKEDKASSSSKMPDIVIKMDHLKTKFFRDKDAKGDCELILCGRNEKLLPKTQGCKMEVLVNDQKVFEGVSAFPSGESFGVQKINIPESVMKDNNTLEIRNLDKYDPRASAGNPEGKISYFSIKYGVFHNK